MNERSGARPFRQDLTKMQRAGGPAWDLYLQALRKFQDMDQNDALSWFQFNGLYNLFVQHTGYGKHKADIGDRHTWFSSG